MKEDSHDIQTVKKEHLPVPSNRKAKQLNTPSKKLHHQQQKVKQSQYSVKKNLSSVLNSTTEDGVVLNLPEKESIEKFSSESVDADHSTVEISKTSLTSDQTSDPVKSVALEHPEQSAGIDLISEAFDFGKDQSNESIEVYPNESIESYIVSLNQFASPASVTPNTVQVTSSSCTSSALSSISTLEMTPLSSPIPSEASPVHVSSGNLQNPRVSMFRFLHSADTDPQYEKLLNALVKLVIEESYNLREEREMVDSLFSRKINIVMLGFVLCMIAICSGFFLLSHGSSYDGPPPT